MLQNHEQLKAELERARQQRVALSEQLQSEQLMLEQSQQRVALHEQLLCDQLKAEHEAAEAVEAVRLSALQFVVDKMLADSSNVPKLLPADWPSKNSRVLASEKSLLAADLPQLLEWLAIRDQLFGANGEAQDIPTALVQAQKCKHPDAVWLCSRVNPSMRLSPSQVVGLLLNGDQSSGRSIALARGVSAAESENLLPGCLSAAVTSFAEYGLLHAQRADRFFRETDYVQAQKSAENAVAAGERDGYYQLAAAKAQQAMYRETIAPFTVAAELGHASAAYHLGKVLPSANPDRWTWLLRALTKSPITREYPLLRADAVKEVHAVAFSCLRCAEDPRPLWISQLFLAIGQAWKFGGPPLSAHFDEEQKGMMNEALKYYEHERAALDARANQFVDAWSKLGVTNADLLKQILHVESQFGRGPELLLSEAEVRRQLNLTSAAKK